MRSASVEELRARLQEAEDALRAIRSGEVDAILVPDESGERVYTLQGAEQPYRDLVEQMPEAAVILTVEGDILYGNRRFETMVGFPMEEVLGGSMYRFISDSDRVALASIAADESGAHSGHLLARERRIAVQFSHTSVVSDGVNHRNLIITDLTEILNAHSDRTRAEQESRSKDEFLAMLGHELRNPLAAISTGIALLRSDPLPDRRTWIEQMITRQVNQLQRLVDDLLDVSRITRGKIELRKEPVLLQKLMEASASAVQDLMSQNGQQFTLSAPSRRIYLHADPARLEQMLSNLLTNASKYTPEGGSIWLSAEQVENEVVIRCRDTGLGLSPEILENIFQPFVQFRSGRSGEGLGMGLTLVRKLAEMHGGSVAAFSEGPEKGSEFVLRLPTAAGTACRILVVDDNRDVAESLSLFLRDAGYETSVAYDGPTAVSVAAEQPPDIVLLDIGLPGLDGYEVADRIRALPQSQPITIIAISGFKVPEERRGTDARFDASLVKPIVLEELLELLQTRMSHPRES